MSTQDYPGHCVDSGRLWGSVPGVIRPKDALGVSGDRPRGAGSRYGRPHPKAGPVYV